MSQPHITLYTQGTPNGEKVSIALEILEIPYKVVKMSWDQLSAKVGWFLKVNPNSKIPAIVDHKNGDYPVFESGAILLYLAENYDPEHRLWPKDSKLQSEVVQWLMFQMAGIGPFEGQAHHFTKAAPQRIEYAINRYVNETKRLYSVLNDRLDGRNYLVGDQLTIADIACYPWISYAYNLAINLDELPNLQAWIQKLDRNPKVVKGVNVPEPNEYILIRNDPVQRKKTFDEAYQSIYGTAETN